MEGEKKKQILVSVFGILKERELITEEEKERLQLFLQETEFNHESMYL